jgi:YgiT-type zinc finger domain-containing protein
MKCLYCGGEMKKARVGYSINRKDYHLYLEEVPAYVCIKCKEKLFEEDEAELIQRLIKRLESDVRQLQMA